MKKILTFAVIGLLVACNDKPKDDISSRSTDSTASTTASTDNLTFPYTAGYSSKFEIGDQKNAQSILNMWKDFDNGNLANSKDKFADSVTFFFADGEVIHGSRDSITAIGQRYRDSYSELHTDVDAWVPLKSTDKNENWVAIWGWEHHTDKNGKVDSAHIHEVWRLNADGKADVIYQFAAAAKKK